MSDQQSLQRQQQGAITRPVSGTLTRLPDQGGISTADFNQANAWLNEAASVGHVVAPAMSIPVQPEGYGVAVTRLQVKDLNTQGNDLYPIKGGNKLGLHKGFLDDIGRAYGCDWPPAWTFPEPYPTGDPRNFDPHCIKITVAGRYKDYDGSWKTLPPLTKEIDLRDGGDEVLAILQLQEDKALYNLGSNASAEAVARAKAEGRKKAVAEIAHARKFIRAYAQTKARLQVIGTLVRRSYTLDELKKPFFIFKTIFTGRSDNPEIAKIYAQRIADREFGASSLLYGASASEPRALPPVSDEPYPEPEDAGVVAEVTTEDRQPAEDVERFCTADVCYGDETDGHMKACKGKVKGQVAESKTENLALPEDWIVPKEDFSQHGGVPVDKLSDAALSSMFDGCVMILDRKELAVEHAKWKEYQKHFSREVDRRRQAKEVAAKG